MKISPVAAKLFHDDGLTDMTKLIVAFTVSQTCLKMKLKPLFTASLKCTKRI